MIECFKKIRNPEKITEEYLEDFLKEEYFTYADRNSGEWVV